MLILGYFRLNKGEGSHIRSGKSFIWLEHCRRKKYPFFTFLLKGGRGSGEFRFGKYNKNTQNIFYMFLGPAVCTIISSKSFKIFLLFCILSLFLKNQPMLETINTERDMLKNRKLQRNPVLCSWSTKNPESPSYF